MKRKLILTLLCLVLIAGAVFAGYQIITTLGEYRAGEEAYQQIQQYIDLPATEPDSQTEPTVSASEPATEPEETESASEPTEPPFVYPDVDFDSLVSVNEDVIAWIYIEDTNINYPVVQGDDNRYYASAMFNHDYNKAGSIFMDYRNQPDFTDKHTIIYGHNMRNGSMFADVRKYQDQEFYDEHPTGLIMTPEKNYHFEVVAAYVASLADNAWQLEFFSDEDLEVWLREAMERSEFTSSTIPTAQDQIITLSTCSYEYSDARFVLVGILKD